MLSHCKETPLDKVQGSYLEVEESDGDVLDELLGHVLGVELGPKLELQRRLLLDILTQNLKFESIFVGYMTNKYVLINEVR